MSTILRNVIPLCASVLFVAAFLLIPSLSDSAHAQCGVLICKSAPELPEPPSPDDAVDFTFTVSQGVESESFELTANGLCNGFAYSGDDFEIVEDFMPGWILDNVDCGEDPNVNITILENGVSLDCLGGSELLCTFTNVRGSTPTNVPTLSEWGMIAAAAGLAFIGVFFAVRRRKIRAV